MTRYGTAPEYTYTSNEEISNVFTNDGFDQHISNMTDPEEYVTSLCEKATGTVNMYLLGKYAAQDLSNSVQIREIATWIAAYKLSVKGGEPELFLYQYQEALDMLKQIKTGELYLELPVRNSTAPVMQNQVVDNRMGIKPLRVVQQTSTRTIGNQQTAYMPYFSWW